MSGSTRCLLLPLSAACLFLFGVCGCQKPETPSTVVTTDLDKVCNTDGLISLREAISYAEEGDRITFADTIPGGTIMELLHGSLKIKKGITIDAESNTNFKNCTLRIDGRGRGRVFSIKVPDGGAGVELIGMVVTGGKESDGGGIFVDRSALTLTRMTVTGNSAASCGGGVSLFRGTLTIAESAITGNRADHYGGGIYNQQGSLTLADSAIVGNSAGHSGGGIYASGYTASVANTRLVGNVAKICGGGICVREGEMTVTGSDVAENYAESGGGIAFLSHQGMTVTDSTITRNSVIESGGGILNEGTLSVAGSTIADNSAVCWQGGGICNWRNLSLAETIVSDNSARVGGGLYSTADRFTFRDTTIDGSPAVDTGTNNTVIIRTDFENPIVTHGVVEIGACEFRGNRSTVRMNPVRMNRSAEDTPQEPTAE